MQAKIKWMKSVALSLTGLFLLLPASIFLLALSIRVFFGSSPLYDNVAPSFLKASNELFAFHKTSWIFFGPLAVILLNALFILLPLLLKVRGSDDRRLQPGNLWFNTAILIQACLLLAAVSSYLIIQHLRW
ncbi:MAG: hypothetical protein C5B59_04220 [Bacteroidetes bacterium]|nr:MAG: hypothetical protein C5B59_04220 [Bacteroidota bacterium]